MESLIMFIIFAVIASLANSRKQAKTQKPTQKFDYTRPQINKRQGKRPANAMEDVRAMVKQISNLQMPMSQAQEKNQNAYNMEFSSDPYVNNTAEETSEGQNAPLTDELAFGLLSYNSTEGKQTEGENIASLQNIPYEVEKEAADDNGLEIEQIDFQRALILSEILGPPKSLKFNRI